MAPDEGVGLVERLHAFMAADGNKSAEPSFIDDAFYGRVKRRVAQDKTERDTAAELAGATVDFLTALQ